MKTILITGGTNGLGKGVAIHFLKEGNRVIIVGSSRSNADIFYNEIKQLGLEENAFFIQANLSLVNENQRVIEEVKNHFHSLDMLIFCAAKHSQKYTKTQEGIETTLALAYLSRFILSYGLKEFLEEAENPVIFNVCGSGMQGEVSWNDLEHKNSFKPQNVMMHSSRLNDLLGVAFVQNDTVGKIKYILYNPWAVQTPGMMELYSNRIMKLIYRIIGKPVEKAVVPIAELLNNLPASTLAAYRERKELDLTMDTFNKENAKQLYDITIQLLEYLASRILN